MNALRFTGATIPGTPLTLSHRARISALLAATGSPLSEYTFPNLFLFRERHHYRFVDGPKPYILGTTYDGERHVMPLTAIDTQSVALLEFADCLYPVGQDGPTLAARLGLSCAWNEDDSDYVYDADRLSILAGAKAKRSHARAFERDEAPVALPIDAERAPLAEAVLAGWRTDVGRTDAETDFVICREALALRETLGLEGLLAMTGAGDPVAFLLASAAPDGTRIVHFAKSRRVHAGAYPWMFRHYAATCGANRLNFEQDLGKPGFARAKRALAPAGQLRKYRLRRRGSTWTG